MSKMAEEWGRVEVGWSHVIYWDLELVIEVEI